MFNLKINIVAAGVAFLLSFLLGILSRSPMPVIFIRPVIFAGVFFMLFAVIQIIANRFLPELFEGGGPAEDEFLPGSRVNISEKEPLATPQDYTPDPPAATVSYAQQSVVGARPNDSDKELDDISGLSSVSVGEGNRGFMSQSVAEQSPLGESSAEQSSHVDQNQISDYTDSGEVEEISVQAKAPVIERAPVEKQAVPDLPDFFIPGAGGGSGSDDLLPDLDTMAGAFAPSSSDAEPESSDFSPAPASKKSSSAKDQAGWAGDFVPKDIASGLRTVLLKDKEA
ncbi:MAG: hypothetical protein FWG77_01550 [Treponema sp.]|nr:hypothetical protein [Treponema sp.]